MKRAWLPLAAALIAAPAMAQDASFANPSPIDFTQPFLYDRLDRSPGLMGSSSPRGLQSGASPRSRGDAQDDVQIINLRGLGAGRTLVLVNGVRAAQAPASQGGEENVTDQPGATSSEKTQPQTGAAE